MKISHLIKKYGWSVFSDGDGACGCGEAYIGGIRIETHCHRSGCKKHLYSCVHVWPDRDWWEGNSKEKKLEMKKIAKLLAKYIEESYMSECEISLKEIK